MITLKPGAELKILRREIYSKLGAIEAAFDMVKAECMITCGTDGHLDDDPHPHGFALDLRSKHLPDAAKTAVRNNLTGYLGPNYTVLLEGQGTDKEHLHLQYRKDLWRQLL